MMLNNDVLVSEGCEGKYIKQVQVKQQRTLRFVWALHHRNSTQDRLASTSHHLSCISAQLRVENHAAFVAARRIAHTQTGSDLLDIRLAYNAEGMI
jgi:hypothetical protein